MQTITQTTGPQPSFPLPAAFANATVRVEQVSEDELRMRKLPAEEAVFSEEDQRPLTADEYEKFLATLNNPLPPTEAPKRAVEMSRKRHD